MEKHCHRRPHSARLPTTSCHVRPGTVERVEHFIRRWATLRPNKWDREMAYVHSERSTMNAQRIAHTAFSVMWCKQWAARLPHHHRRRSKHTFFMGPNLERIRFRCRCFRVMFVFLVLSFFVSSPVNSGKSLAITRAFMRVTLVRVQWTKRYAHTLPLRRSFYSLRWLFARTLRIPSDQRPEC